MAVELSLRVLGPLEVWRDGRRVALGAAKQRALLALLLIRGGEVGRDVLIDALWGERPPKQARNTLQVYVSSLRKALGREAIETTPAGYRVVLGPGAVDADQFEELYRTGVEAATAGDAARAQELLSEALSLWRGPAFADLRFEVFVRAECGRLDELRLVCVEERLEAELKLGRQAALVPELEALVAEYPLRERLRAQLILALYRSGRQSEALAQYQAARRMLTEELGLEPSPELRDLERMILAHDPGLTAASHKASSSRRLPWPVSSFGSRAGTGAGDVDLRREAPVGRESELIRIDSFLEIAERRLRALSVSGPAGIGKTTVWRECALRAADRGFLVLAARPSGAEARLSYAALADLLAPVEDGVFGTLPDLQRRPLDVALLRTEMGTGRVDARAVAAGVTGLIRNLAESAPVLIAVDDAQWLDASTASALAFAVRRLDDMPVGVLAAVRITDVHADTFERALPQAVRDEVALEGLDVAALHEIVKGELGLVFPRPTLARIVEACDGNPFYVLEMARELDPTGLPAASARLPVPEEFQTLARARLARLPARTRGALLAASCLTRPNIDLVDVSALAAAEQAGVVSVGDDLHVQFRHPLFAAAVYEAAPIAHRREAHRTLAERVTDPEERARHLALATDKPDDGIASELDAAARLARARGAPLAAANLLEHALRLATPANKELERERTLEAAACYIDAGDLARAQQLVEQGLDAAPSAQLRARGLCALAKLHSRRNNFGQAIEVALEALDLVGDDLRLRVELEGDLALYHTGLADFPGAAPHAAAAVVGAEELGDDSLLGSPLAVLTIVEFMGGRGLNAERLARAVSLDDASAHLLVRPLYIHGILMLWSGNLQEACTTLEALRVEALEQGRESDVPLCVFFLAWALVWRGDLQRAADLGRELHHMASSLDDRFGSAIALGVAAQVHAYVGGAELARAEAREAAEMFAELKWRDGSIHPPWALGLLESALGHPAEVDAVLSPLCDFVIGMGPVDPVFAVFLPDEIEALIELGQAKRAAKLLDWFEQRARALDRSWAIAAAGRCRGLLQASDADLGGALATVQGTLELYSQLTFPLEQARTVLALGRVLRRMHDRHAARAAFEEALFIFDECGALLWAKQAQTELARIPARRT